MIACRIKAMEKIRKLKIVFVIGLIMALLQIAIYIIKIYYDIGFNQTLNVVNLVLAIGWFLASISAIMINDEKEKRKRINSQV
jgi:hypothetical protein